ncbi:MAG: hypothetical protein JW976_06125 [Syntrophaceae bacterium]|nr:hypothetical protein [Syntrophaceae bacterium]
MNKVSGIVFSLATDYRIEKRHDVLNILMDTASRFKKIKIEELSCDKLVDYFITLSFISKAGIKIDPLKNNSLIEKCITKATSNEKTLWSFYCCRFAEKGICGHISDSLDLLESLQLPDGSFSSKKGEYKYYLTSHAILALYFCNGNQDAVKRGQEYLLGQMGKLKSNGFIDELAESLIFLKWMKVDISGYEEYLEYINSKVKDDGSICATDISSCVSNWHTTSLLFELQNWNFGYSMLDY